MPKSKKYQPPRNTNPIVFDKKIEKLRLKIDTLQQNQKSLIMSFNYHMEHLANFARHDMGNAIQNLSANIQLIKNSLSNESLEAINISIRNLESSLNNLGELIHVNEEGTFTVPRLMRNIEVFVRSSLKVSHISFKTEFDCKDETQVKQPFQTMLQLLHNLILNAAKALKNSDEKTIKLTANITDGQVVIKVMDTGCGINDDILPKIFNFGFTTTEGSGIGLYHAKSVCDEIGGSIKVDRFMNGFSTIFTLKFPTNDNKEDSCD